jgi:hypothetical protein
MPKGSMSTEGETLQVLILPYRCGLGDVLTSKCFWQTFIAHARHSRPMARPACSFRSVQTVTVLKFHVPLTNCFVRSWFCLVQGPKLPVHRHNWLGFGKFQDTEHFLIPCQRHVSSRPHPSGETWKYATAPSTQNKLGEALYLLIRTFLLCLSWLLRTGFRNFWRKLWITLY